MFFGDYSKIPVIFRTYCREDEGRLKIGFYSFLMSAFQSGNVIRSWAEYRFTKIIERRVMVYTMIVSFYKLRISPSIYPHFENEVKRMIYPMNQISRASWVKYAELIDYCENFLINHDRLTGFYISNINQTTSAPPDDVYDMINSRGDLR